MYITTSTNKRRARTVKIAARAGSSTVDNEIASVGEKGYKRPPPASPILR